MTTTAYSVPASRFLDAFRTAGVTHVVTVPDYVQISVHQEIAAGKLAASVVNCATEDEAVAIGLGLWIGGAWPVLMMQNQGVYASANALRSAGVHVSWPLVLIVGQWGRELENLGREPTASARREVRQTEGLLDALEIPWLRLEHPDDAGVLDEAFVRAEAEHRPIAVMVGAHTAWG